MPDNIKKIKERLINVTKVVDQFKKDILSEKVKKSKTAGALAQVDPLGQLPSEGPRSPAAHHFHEFLKEEAKRSLSEALVPSYGCSKCRYFSPSPHCTCTE